MAKDEQPARAGCVGSVERGWGDSGSKTGREGCRRKGGRKIPILKQSSSNRVAGVY